MLARRHENTGSEIKDSFLLTVESENQLLVPQALLSRRQREEEPLMPAHEVRCPAEEETQA